ncbi:ankyrin repeat domain-containing protein [Psychroserpens jangbogonensis]|uniref:ankyrin repeat domain-containing protein n=1 Tax=Psychroserpens jangbogonensis TaxID=1484460 RepID=UPI00053E345A|nr:ankyrin repeat domain-containing protein [Psychroserpens jangbogonensis]
MKKSVIIVAIAMAFSVTALNAKNVISNTSTYEVVVKKSTVSPFCISIVKGDIETVQKLIDLGINVNKSSKGMTPAMYAAKYNRLDILKLLVENGAKLKAKSDKGLTAKKYAEASNAKDALSYLRSLES